jgi:hypothetical protein
MLRHMLSTVMLVGCCFLATTSVTGAVSKAPREKPKTSVQIIHPKFALVAKLTAGILTGQAADTLEGSKNTSVVGGGIAWEYSPRVPSRLGLNVELVYGRSHKVQFDDKDGKVRSLSYSGSWLYLFTPSQRSSFFGRAEFGFSHLTPINPDLVETQTHSFLRLGIGNSRYSGSSIATRFELYYKRLFTDGAKLTPTSPTSDIRFDTTYVGLEFSMSFAL